MEELNKLAQELTILSGVGQKTALRYAYEILECLPDQRVELINSIKSLDSIVKCKTCNNYCKSEICEICEDTSRDIEKLVVVVTQKDVLKIEKILPKEYYYYVLGSIINPLKGVDADFLKIDKIEQIIKVRNVKEIILVLPTNQEGEITAEYLKNILTKYNVEFSKIAQGVPIGGDLEYLDELTLLRSIQKRQDF